ncbi:MAG TPA: hypothetical protein PKG52_04455 [bacterium]|nr:hypothetical protein [bacterium]HPS29812.1 hypothetical protein [bacterium]
MINMSKTGSIIIMVLIICSAVSLVMSLINYKSKEISEKKLIAAAKEIEELKLDVAELKRLTGSRSVAENRNDNTNISLLQDKLNKMRSELGTLRKQGGSKALEEYKKERNKFLMDYANEVKKSWTEFLHKALVEKGMDPDDIEMIKYDYNVMLDKIRDEQFRLYEGDSTEEELNETVKGYAKDFFTDMSKSVGDRKASITLGIVFPDQLYRKSLFEDDK